MSLQLIDKLNSIIQGENHITDDMRSIHQDLEQSFDKLDIALNKNRQEDEDNTKVKKLVGVDVGVNTDDTPLPWRELMG